MFEKSRLTIMVDDLTKGEIISIKRSICSLSSDSVVFAFFCPSCDYRVEHSKIKDDPWEMKEVRR